MPTYVNERALYDELHKAGFVPEGCRIIDLHIGAGEVIKIRYEVLITAENLSKFGEALSASMKKFLEIK